MSNGPYSGHPYQVPPSQAYPSQPPGQAGYSSHPHQQPPHGHGPPHHQQHQHPYFASSSSGPALGPNGYYHDPYQQQQHASYQQHHDRQPSHPLHPMGPPRMDANRPGSHEGHLPAPPPARGSSRQQTLIPAQTTDWESQDVKPPKGGPSSSSAPPSQPASSSSAPTRALSTRKRSTREAHAQEGDGDQDDSGVDGPAPTKPKGPGSGKTPVVGASEFVLKLYAMLNDASYTPVVGWNSKGDSFIVKDLNTFGTTILPQTFRHSNFASFVRQLNKYDFHKVKGEEGRNFGDNVWEFRHPHFRQDTPETLENVKRKAVPPKKNGAGSVPLNSSTASSSHQHEDSGSPQEAPPGSPQVTFTGDPSATTVDPAAFYALQQQVNVLQQSQTTMYNHVQTLHTKYQKIINDLVILQRNNTSTEALVGDVVQYLVKNENETPGESSFTPSSAASDYSGRENGTSSHPSSRLHTAQSDLLGSQSVDSPGSSRSTHSRDGSRSARNTNGKGKEREHVDDQTLRGWEPGQRPAPTHSSNPSGPAFQNPQPFGKQPNGTHSHHAPPPMNALYPGGPPPNAAPSAASRSGPNQMIGPADGEEYSDGQPTNGGDANGSYPMFSSHGDFWNGPGGSAYQEQVRSALSEQGAIFGENVDASGLRVFTVGHLRPRAEEDAFDDDDGGPLSAYPSGTQHQQNQPQQGGEWGQPPPPTSYQQAEPSSRPTTAPGFQPQQDQSFSGGAFSRPATSGGNGPAPQQPAPNAGATNKKGTTQDVPPLAATVVGPLTGAGTSSFPIKNRNSIAEGSSNAVASGSSTVSRPPGTLRVRRSTYVPGWSVAPRVLIVEDDAVVRKMSTKLLEVAGCTIDVAVDGVEAVNQMNLSRYDLVLMDIVMPNLDGVSATSLIRQFDDLTPIISMTSNSAPEEILSYMSSGMSGHISKPFSKEGLIGMVEKHLVHMTTVQSLSHVPRTPGVPPLSDAHVQDAVQQGVVSLQGGDQDLSNPLGGMGLADGDYMAMLHNLLSNSNGAVVDGMQSTLFAGSFSSASGIGMGNLGFNKRNLDEDDDLEDNGDGKRHRFEHIDE